MMETMNSQIMNNFPPQMNPVNRGTHLTCSGFIELPLVSAYSNAFLETITEEGSEFEISEDASVSYEASDYVSLDPMPQEVDLQYGLNNRPMIGDIDGAVGDSTIGITVPFYHDMNDMGYHHLYGQHSKTVFMSGDNKTIKAPHLVSTFESDRSFSSTADDKDMKPKSSPVFHDHLRLSGFHLLGTTVEPSDFEHDVKRMRHIHTTDFTANSNKAGYISGQTRVDSYQFGDVAAGRMCHLPEGSNLNARHGMTGELECPDRYGEEVQVLAEQKATGNYVWHLQSNMHQGGHGSQVDKCDALCSSQRLPLKQECHMPGSTRGSFGDAQRSRLTNDNWCDNWSGVTIINPYVAINDPLDNATQSKFAENPVCKSQCGKPVEGRNKQLPYHKLQGVEKHSYTANTTASQLLPHDRLHWQDSSLNGCVLQTVEANKISQKHGFGICSDPVADTVTDQISKTVLSKHKTSRPDFPQLRKQLEAMTKTPLTSLENRINDSTSDAAMPNIVDKSASTMSSKVNQPLVQYDAGSMSRSNSFPSSSCSHSFPRVQYTESYQKQSFSGQKRHVDLMFDFCQVEPEDHKPMLQQNSDLHGEYSRAKAVKMATDKYFSAPTTIQTGETNKHAHRSTTVNLGKSLALTSDTKEVVFNSASQQAVETSGSDITDIWRRPTDCSGDSEQILRLEFAKASPYSTETSVEQYQHTTGLMKRKIYESTAIPNNCTKLNTVLNSVSPFQQTAVTADTSPISFPTVNPIFAQRPLQRSPAVLGVSDLLLKTDEELSGIMKHSTLNLDDSETKTSSVLNVSEASEPESLNSLDLVRKVSLGQAEPSSNRRRFQGNKEQKRRNINVDNAEVDKRSFYDYGDDEDEDDCNQYENGFYEGTDLNALRDVEKQRGYFAYEPINYFPVHAVGSSSFERLGFSFVWKDSYIDVPETINPMRCSSKTQKGFGSADFCDWLYIDSEPFIHDCMDEYFPKAVRADLDEITLTSSRNSLRSCWENESKRRAPAVTFERNNSPREQNECRSCERHCKRISSEERFHSCDRTSRGKRESPQKRPVTPWIFKLCSCVRSVRQ